MPSTSITEQSLSLRQLIVYGTGGLIPIALFNAAGQLMGLMGNISLGLSAFWLGVILIIPRLWDAISDPIVGHLSDNTRSRFGRRRPFLLMGGLAVAISFVLMWWVPKGDLVQGWFATESAYQWFQLAYILFFLLVFFTACTLFEIPHGALGMEMSADPHERTRLFSAKSFFGNVFAMATPWLFALANLELFRGAGGNEIDGMRYVSMIVAAVLIPLSIWWFVSNREPGFSVAASKPKTPFWQDMQRTIRNKTFLILLFTIFTLAMGFNFVNLLTYYISIFYLYGGDKLAAGALLGINGTIWAITGLLAVFPLNWISPKLGKRKTLMLSIGLMCAAQLAKIFCYNPDYPYLVLIPTVLLSAGMLFFFTLGPSMVGDICDEDDLKTGQRVEGSYYSIYWWFIKMGTALASFVTGVLIVFTQFDETQVKQVDALQGSIREIHAELTITPLQNDKLSSLISRAAEQTAELNAHLTDPESAPISQSHQQQLLVAANSVQQQLNQLAQQQFPNQQQLSETLASVDKLLPQLKQQAPASLLRMRIVEIGLPLLLSLISLLFAWHYPLTEQRCQEIKQALIARRESNQ